jgi:hypothetical protein
MPMRIKSALVDNKARIDEKTPYKEWGNRSCGGGESDGDIDVGFIEYEFNIFDTK